MKSRFFPALLGLTFLFFPVASSPAKTAEEVNNYLKRTVLPEFLVENIPATDALASVQKLANLNQYGIFFDLEAREKLKKSSITLSLKNVPAYDVIAMICALSGVKFAVKKDQVLIFEKGGNAGP